MDTIEINATLGDYAQKVEELTDKLSQLDSTSAEYASTVKELSEAQQDLEQATGDYAEQVDEVKAKTSDAASGLSSLGSALASGASSFGATGMAVAKFGGSMGVATGALKTFVKGWKALRVAMASNPIGLAITALVGLTLAFKEYKSEQNKVSESQKAFNTELANQREQIYQSTNTLNRLSNEWKSLKTIQEKNEFIKNNSNEFHKLGIEVNGVSDAESVLRNNTSAVQKSFQLRALAAAKAAESVALYKEYLDKLEQAKTLTLLDKAKAFAESLNPYGPSYEEALQKRRDALNKEADAAKRRADQSAADAGKINSQISNIVNSLQSASGHTASIAKNTGNTESVLDKIEAKYKAINDELDVRELENEVYLTNEYDKALAKLLISRERYNAKLGEANDKYKAGLISEKEFEVIERRITAELTESLNTWDEYIRGFGGEVQGPTVAPGMLDIKTEGEIFGQVMQDVQKHLEDTKQAALDLRGALDGITTADIFLNPERSLEALGRIEAQMIAAGNAVPDDLKRKKLVAGIVATSSAMSDLGNAVANAWQESIEAEIAAGHMSQEEGEKQFEQIKALEIATATVGTIAGAVGVFMKDLESYPAPFGAILAPIDAAVTLAAGYAQIQTIRRQKIGSSSAGGGTNIITSAATPLLNEAQDMNQLDMLSVGTEQPDQKVYIVDHEIADALDHRKVVIDNATF